VYHGADGKPAVWMYDAPTRKVALRAVTLGTYREDGVVVTSGVSPGEWVVSAGVHKLQAGQTVRPYEAPGRAVPPEPAGASPTQPAIMPAPVPVHAPASAPAAKG
jgi:multidrug efflux system membrane fusion protein